MAKRDARKKQHASKTAKKNAKAKKKAATSKKRAAQRTWLPTKGTLKRLAKLADDIPHCGLCGAAENLIKTECCGNWICDDSHTYRLFSYAQNSCYRNHSRYTLCGFHHTEGHPGSWKDCQKCREQIDETEMYVYYGTNEFNFETLENPPRYDPTHCSQCGAVIRLGQESHCYSAADGYRCDACTMKQHPGLYR